MDSHRTSAYRRVLIAIALSVFALFFGVGSAGALAAGTPAEGPGVILDQRAGSDVVCVMVAVDAGSSCESSETRGVCHLIEHLVFDGSERYSREQMSGWVDDVGGFLNAFTRKETTVYFLLVPSAHLEKGVEILSQMLLHSIFIPEELEKERKVILEEIRRETDDPRSAPERILDRCLYRGSRLAEPVIGYPSTIRTMSEGAVKAFYRIHYVPASMRVVFMGGFDPAKAMDLVRDYFPMEDGDSRRAADESCGAPSIPRWSNEIAERIDAQGANGLDLIVPFPSAAEKSFPAALLVSRMLEGDRSPLTAKLASLSLGAPEINLETYRGFSALRIHVGAAEAGADACRKVPEILASLSEWAPTKEDLESSRVSFLSSEIFDREMYHFYIMSKGEAIALHGERYLSLFAGPIAQVNEKDCASVLKRAFRPIRFNACLIRKEADPPGAADGASGAPAFEVLPNGCTLGALARPGSPVAALHLLLKGRACLEGSTPAGRVETLVSLLESSRAGRGLRERLEKLGARVQFGDNPYVPQDDYLLSPAYAFIRLEAPAEAMRNAASLLIRHLLESELTNEDLEKVKADLAGEVGMRSASPYYVMRAAMMAGLFGSHPFAAPVFPPPGAMMRFSLDELQALRERMFVGGNIIATLVSPGTTAQGCAMLRTLLAAVPQGAAPECPPPSDSTKVLPLDMTTRKEGAYIASGWLARSAEPSGRASILVAGEILSRRMQLELREKRGLAYSIECGVTPLPGGAVVMAYLGTGAPRSAEARSALEGEIRGLRERAPDAAEVEIAKSRLLGKRSRSELSSINRAYALGFDMFLNGTDGFHSMNELLGAVSAEDVKGVIESALSMDGALMLRLMPESSSGR